MSKIIIYFFLLLAMLYPPLLIWLILAVLIFMAGATITELYLRMCYNYGQPDNHNEMTLFDLFIFLTLVYSFGALINFWPRL